MAYNPEKKKAWYLANKDRIKKRLKAYRATPEGKAKIKAAQARHKAKNPIRVHARKRAWNLCRLEKLAGRPCPKKCELCGSYSEKRLNFDHDHTTGRFRGWLCMRCNTLLGRVQDSPIFLRRLIQYLEISCA